MRFDAAFAQFAFLCFVWGLTWIAAKTGVSALPPLLFIGSRFFVGGLILWIWQALRGQGRLPPGRSFGRLAVVALLTVSIAPGLLFYGVLFVPSGLGAVVNLSLVPVGMYALGVAYGQEKRSRSFSLAILCGIGGLALLFAPRIGPSQGAGELFGIAAIVLGTLAHCWGSVLGRPLIAHHGAVPVSLITNGFGGLVLVIVSFATESPLSADLSRIFEPGVGGAWAFLLFTTVFAWTIYLRLVRDWGVVRAGLYAFVSPVIAVAVGAIFFGERFGPSDIAAMAVMLGATWIALRRPFDRK